jgi:hypothetical protein
MQAFTASAQHQRDLEYVAAELGNITSASDLVSDRRLLRVALGAFGLQNDLDNKAFIERILSDGTSNADALSNRLADKRYREFSEAFGFGETALPKTLVDGFSHDIASAYSERQFEEAVGDQNNTLRLALNLERELDDISSSSQSNAAMWYSVLGSPPLRSVFETTFGLPSAFAQLDLDRQLESLQQKSEQHFGTSELSAFSDPELRETLTKRFLLMSEIISQASFSPSQVALTLLSAIG